MRLKLDENLGKRGAERLRFAGHDVATVPEERWRSASDQVLIQVCVRERRSLVTLDLDFANPIVFDPRSHCGVAVLRLPHRPSPDDSTWLLRP